ncbi:unnamed protein product [Musa acuminata subsp. malaccensis]|uniref:(wild Malaysian banana) hypothetical protein n=1 Tax=Musa acuminata subsp. malaccensis TaxID=214687 RepID=A0A8D7FS24_MUSAM|nr:unnamed protein product [Musa acuminata subsp. malaccensis]
MAMILNFFVTRYIGEIADFVEREVCEVLGVKKEIETLHRRLETIKVYLQDADRKRHDSAAIDAWVRKLKDVMCDADDVMDLCMMEGGRLLEAPRSASAVSSPLRFVSSCFRCAKYRHEIAGRIRALDDRLKKMAEDNAIISTLQLTIQVPQIYETVSHATSHLEVKGDIVGAQIEIAAENLIGRILEEDQQKCRVFGIVGMGGIGKTTLARKIFNDERIKDNFPIRKWLYVPKNYSDTDLLKELIRCVAERSEGGEPKAETFKGKSRAELEPKLASLLTSNFFLVLDDVWSANVWTDLLRRPIITGEASSTILVTTRTVNVAKIMKCRYTHPVEKMDEESGWKLLRKIVFEAGEEAEIAGLEDTGTRIVEMCDGLPLAIKAMGGVLSPKEKTKAEWENVLRSDAWSMNSTDKELPRALHLSYEDFPPHLKQCFLYCSLYPEKSDLYYKEIVRLWVAEGLILKQGDRLVEDIAEEYYRELVCRSLLQVNPSYADHSYFSMHDLYRTLGANLMQEEGISIVHGRTFTTNTNTKIRRLSVSKMGHRLELPDEVMRHKCLRTLILADSFNTLTIEENLLRSLPHLRVLDLSNTSIEGIPDFIGDLLHLRYLNLNGTSVQEIPESIGRLANLQTLNVSECESLRKLPMAITRLHNLRCLHMEQTPLTHIPKGIRKLDKVNNLQGFVVGHEDPTKPGQGCALEELQSLCKLSCLSISSLERAVAGASVLAEKPFLKELTLGDNTRVEGATWSEEQIQGAEKICNELSPPSSLRDLALEQFPALRLPVVHGAAPLGTLPKLKFLNISGAKALKTIGPEFVGHSSLAFPKLETLQFINMPKWEEWSLGWAEEAGNGTQPKLLPNLKNCLLKDCPKLKALPQGLSYATNLKGLSLRQTYELREITNLPLADKLEVTNNMMLSRISDLSAVKYLKVYYDCPSLENVENLHSLRHLFVKCPPTMTHLPPWLSGLVDERQSAPAAQWSFSKFELQCNLVLLKSCLRGHQNWHIIQRIPNVKIQTFSGNEYIRYVKDTDMYDTNVLQS